MNHLKKSLVVIAMSGFVMNANAHDAHDSDTMSMGENQSPNHQTFMMFDTNNDGVLSATELSKDPSFTKERIAKADHDNDGTLDESEYTEEKVKSGEADVKRVASDSWITAQAKTKLLTEESLKSLKISIETFKGEVLLSGFVANEALKDKAEDIVSKVEGVKSVNNGIVVKK